MSSMSAVFNSLSSIRSEIQIILKQTEFSLLIIKDMPLYCEIFACRIADEVNAVMPQSFGSLGLTRT